jgi:RNA-directed DNA polymerase
MDIWLEREFPKCRFERYADDAIIHCERMNEALRIKAALERRMEECGLQLHLEKAGIVYCKDSNRTAKGMSKTSFDFLGYTFDQDWLSMVSVVNGSPVGCQRSVARQCDR